MATGQDREIKDIKTGEKKGLFSDYMTIDFFGCSTRSDKPQELTSEFIVKAQDKLTR